MLTWNRAKWVSTTYLLLATQLRQGTVSLLNPWTLCMVWCAVNWGCLSTCFGISLTPLRLKFYPHLSKNHCYRWEWTYFWVDIHRDWIAWLPTVPSLLYCIVKKNTTTCFIDIKKRLRLFILCLHALLHLDFKYILGYCWFVLFNTFLSKVFFLPKMFLLPCSIHSMAPFCLLSLWHELLEGILIYLIQSLRISMAAGKFKPQTANLCAPFSTRLPVSPVFT